MIFLILDIFLISQFIIQKSENTYDLIQDTPIDQQLKADNIQIKTELPLKPTKASYVEQEMPWFFKPMIFLLYRDSLLRS